MENVSPHIFDQVSLWHIPHGRLAPGERSQYTLVEEMFDKVSVIVEIDTTQFSQIVIDYIGEDPLRPGDFTLQVNITDLADPSSIMQNLIRD